MQSQWNSKQLDLKQKCKDLLVQFDKYIKIFENLDEKLSNHIHLLYNVKQKVNNISAQDFKRDENFEILNLNSYQELIQKESQKIQNELNTFNINFIETLYESDNSESAEDNKLDDSESDNDNDNDSTQSKNSNKLDNIYINDKYELENQYQEAFNFLRNQAGTQNKNFNKQSLEIEQQINIKLMEMISESLIVVVTQENQIRIFDLKLQGFNSNICYQFDEIVSTMKIANTSTIVVGRQDGFIEVLNYDDKNNKINSNTKMYQIINERGKIIIEKMQNVDQKYIACLGIDRVLKIFETHNFKVISNKKLSHLQNQIPTCLFIKSKNDYFVGGKKFLFYKKQIVPGKFQSEIIKISQFGDKFLVAEYQNIHLLIKIGFDINPFYQIVKYICFYKQQIEYISPIQDTNFIFINCKQKNSCNYISKLVEIKEIENEYKLIIQDQPLNQEYQIKLLKKYQQSNKILVYAFNNQIIREYQLVQEKGQFKIV